MIDPYCGTSNANISAGGDVTGGWMLASTAAMQGRLSVLRVMGHPACAPMSTDAIAGTVFTRPEIANVGLTESRALADDVRVRGDPPSAARQPARPDRGPDPRHDQARVGS